MDTFPIRYKKSVFKTTMKQITFWQKLRYWFDNSLSGGTVSLIAWLAVISLIVILISAIFLIITGLYMGDEPYTFAEAFWQSLMRSIDAGSVAGDEGWSFRMWMFLVTIFGIFIFSSLIGVLTSGLEAKIDELQKGRSLVAEENHTLILGWSSRIFLIIAELCQANVNANKPRIVILADKDKVEMEDEIREKVGDTGKTKVICRTGSPIDLDDLEIVNPQNSKSIIVLSPEDASDPDSQVIKMILALTNSPNRRETPYHIVAEIRETENAPVTKMVGKDEVDLVLINDLISRITAQTCRQTGLSVIYKELLDFGGAEIYLKDEPALYGQTYHESVADYDDCAVIGIAEKNGNVRLNPPSATKINDGDKIVVIADDDDRINFKKPKQFNSKLITHAEEINDASEKLLVLGWNKRGRKIVEELDKYVGKGSELMVVSEIDETEKEVNEIAQTAKNLTIDFKAGITSDRKLLDSLDLTSFKHIILLCYSDDYEVQEADSKTLITLLHLRDIESLKGDSYSVVSEMLDVKNRALAEVAKADDFIVSDELAGLLMTQISENKILGKVFEDLFDSEGAEIYLKPADDFVQCGINLDFYTVIESASQLNQTAIGYRIEKESNNADKNYGVYVNPRKSDSIAFTTADKIIVLASE